MDRDTLARLGDRLQDLDARHDRRASLDRDPLGFAHRYTDPGDQELAGFVAAGLAYGRVDLFRPVVAALLDRADVFGGPRAYAEGFDSEREASVLAPLLYRFNRHPDFVLLWGMLQDVLAQHGSLGALFAAGVSPGHRTIQPALTRWVETLRALAMRRAEVSRYAELRRGVRYWLPSPAQGSACKRLNLYLRWMVRPADGVDLGLWDVSPRLLIMPVDVHIHRVSRFVGLTRRNDASWRTAVEITDTLRRLDPEDPVRFDFALAHLGISGACQGARVAAICEVCPLDSLCLAPPREA